MKKNYWFLRGCHCIEGYLFGFSLSFCCLTVTGLSFYCPTVQVSHFPILFRKPLSGIYVLAGVKLFSSQLMYLCDVDLLEAAQMTSQEKQCPHTTWPWWNCVKCQCFLLQSSVTIASKFSTSLISLFKTRVVPFNGLLWPLVSPTLKKVVLQFFLNPFWIMTLPPIWSFACQGLFPVCWKNDTFLQCFFFQPPMWSTRCVLLNQILWEVLIILVAVSAYLFQGKKHPAWMLWTLKPSLSIVWCVYVATCDLQPLGNGIFLPSQ